MNGFRSNIPIHTPGQPHVPHQTPPAYSLEDRIKFAIEHCDKHSHNYTICQNYLADGFARYIHPYKYKEDTPLLEMVKQHYLDGDKKSRFEDIVSKYDLGDIEENNKLLLIKAIYIEAKYEIPKN